MKINKCNDECRVWTGLGTQHRTHLSEDWGRSLWHWQPQSRICFLRWAQSQRPTRWRRTFVNIISCRSFVSLSRSSTSTSRSDRSAQAKPPSAMSSDSAEFSPELRVSICHRVHTGSVWTVPDDWSMTRPVFFFCPFFRSNPRRQPRSAASRTDTMTGQDMFVFFPTLNDVQCFQQVKDSDKEEPQLLPNETLQDMGGSSLIGSDSLGQIVLVN